jgi:hypothetical protein
MKFISLPELIRGGNKQKYNLNTHINMKVESICLIDHLFIIIQVMQSVVISMDTCSYSSLSLVFLNSLHQASSSLESKGIQAKLISSSRSTEKERNEKINNFNDEESDDEVYEIDTNEQTNKKSKPNQSTSFSTLSKKLRRGLTATATVERVLSNNVNKLSPTAHLMQVLRQVLRAASIISSYYLFHCIISVDANDDESEVVITNSLNEHVAIGKIISSASSSMYSKYSLLQIPKGFTLLKFCFFNFIYLILFFVYLCDVFWFRFRALYSKAKVVALCPSAVTFFAIKYSFEQA